MSLYYADAMRRPETTGRSGWSNVDNVLKNDDCPNFIRDGSMSCSERVMLEVDSILK